MGKQMQMSPTIAITSTPANARIPALDFTKGMLVLFMVVYHWLNAFYGFKDDIYKYLRFLTPSFMFITGFLISNVYFSRPKELNRAVPKRLAQRGLKILGIFASLNAAIYAMPHSGWTVVERLGVRSLIAVFVTGNPGIPGVRKLAAFEVLVPIGYILLISAALSWIFAAPKYVFYVACLLCFAGVFTFDAAGAPNGILEGVALGLMGVSLGYIPLSKINRIALHVWPLAAAYACYIVAITIWNVIFPLQVAGLCLILILLYSVGLRIPAGSTIGSQVNLLGHYSLVGYIGQIGIIQVLHRIMSRLDLLDRGVPSLGLSLAAAFALTLLLVIVVDQTRSRVVAVNKLYRFAFA